eukprot:g15116.t1
MESRRSHRRSGLTEAEVLAAAMAESARIFRASEPVVADDVDATAGEPSRKDVTKAPGKRKGKRKRNEEGSKLDERPPDLKSVPKVDERPPDPEMDIETVEEEQGNAEKVGSKPKKHKSKKENRGDQSCGKPNREKLQKKKKKSHKKRKLKRHAEDQDAAHVSKRKKKDRSTKSKLKAKKKAERALKKKEKKHKKSLKHREMSKPSEAECVDFHSFVVGEDNDVSSDEDLQESEEEEEALSDSTSNDEEEEEEGEDDKSSWTKVPQPGLEQQLYNATQKKGPMDDDDVQAQRLRIAQNRAIKKDKVERSGARAGFIHRHLPAFQAFIPEKTLSALRTAVPSEESTAALDKNLKIQSADIVFADESLALRDYQLRGVEWLLNLQRVGVGGILADEMGLGKTIQTVVFLSYLKDRLGIAGPHLIICPLSVLAAWRDEFARWMPSLKVMQYHGPTKERNRVEKLLQRPGYDVVLTTYEMIKAGKDFWSSKLMWRHVILDEAHRIKNATTALSQLIRSLQCVSFYFLTGTPVQNNLKELGCLVSALFPEVFTSSLPFEETVESSEKFKSQALDAAHKLVEPIMLRRLKKVVELAVPQKLETTLYIPLKTHQAEMYQKLLCDGKSLHDPSSSVMSLFTELRKVCLHPHLLDGPEVTLPKGKQLISASSKLVVLDEMLLRLRKEGHRVLLFSQWATMLDIFQQYCEYRKFPFSRLDGSVNRVKRRIDVRRFNMLDSSFLFLISTQAGGLGINLTGADTVILYDSNLNPQIDLQAIARAHRIGQTKEVHVYRLVAEGTVEEHILRRTHVKLQLHALVSDRSSEKFSLEDPDMVSLLLFGPNRQMKMLTADSDKDLNLDLLLKRSKGNTGDDEAFVDKENRQSDCNIRFTKGSGNLQLVSSSKINALEFGPSSLEQSRYRDFTPDVAFTPQVNEKAARSLKDVVDPSLPRGMRSRTTRFDMKKLLGPGERFLAEPPTALEVNENPMNQPCELREPRKEWKHEDSCHLCKDDNDLSVAKCQWCPRVYHDSCIPNTARNVANVLTCPQHSCAVCNRSTSSCGGLLFRCTVCPCAYCEDHVPPERIELAECEELEQLGYTAPDKAFFICCSEDCIKYYQENDYERSDWVAKQSSSILRVREDKEHDCRCWAGDPPANATALELHCICRKPSDSSQFYLRCCKCSLFFHGGCVGVDEDEQEFINKFFCPSCEHTAESGSPRKTTWLPSRELLSWTMPQVQDFLRKIGMLATLGPTFEENEITGEELGSLRYTDLHETFGIGQRDSLHLLENVAEVCRFRGVRII